MARGRAFSAFVSTKSRTTFISSSQWHRDAACNTLYTLFAGRWFRELPACSASTCTRRRIRGHNHGSDCGTTSHTTTTHSNHHNALRHTTRSSRSSTTATPYVLLATKHGERSPAVEARVHLVVVLPLGKRSGGRHGRGRSKHNARAVVAVRMCVAAAAQRSLASTARRRSLRARAIRHRARTHAAAATAYAHATPRVRGGRRRVLRRDVAAAVDAAALGPLRRRASRRHNATRRGRQRRDHERRNATTSRQLRLVRALAARVATRTAVAATNVGNGPCRATARVCTRGLGSGRRDSWGGTDRSNGTSTHTYTHTCTHTCTSTCSRTHSHCHRHTTTTTTPTPSTTTTTGTSTSTSTGAARHGAATSACCLLHTTVDWRHVHVRPNTGAGL
jgi:hypothetical protein